MPNARRSAGTKGAATPPPPSQLELEVVAFLTVFAWTLGLPKSYGQLYGLLFIAGRPLSLEDFIRFLGISRGSVSHGLRDLRNAGAIYEVSLPGARRIHYEADTDLPRVVTRLVQRRLHPRLDHASQKLQQLCSAAQQLPPSQRARLSGRLALLTSWEKKVRQVVPLLSKEFTE